MATMLNPKYCVYVVNKKGNKYDITNALTDLVLSETESGIAQKVTLSMKQMKHDGTYTTKLINVHDKLYVYVNTGNGTKELFRGYIWIDVYNKDDTNEISLTAYDRLIYLTESQEYKFYSSGKSTKSIFQDICKSKGITLKYSHSSIKHSKLVIKGTLADAFKTDLLEEVRKKTGSRGVIRYTQGTLEVFTEGKGSSSVYKLYSGDKGNIISSKHTVTMDGITTKVIILGSEKDNKQAPIKATVIGNTSEYGTIQKIVSSSDSDKLADLKKEAKQTIKDNGEPQKNVEVVAVNNPWVRKGDKVYLEDGYRSCYGHVKSITHDVQKGTMNLELRLIAKSTT